MMAASGGLVAFYMPHSLPESKARLWLNCMSRCFTGTFWTASAHVITAVIGSGVLSLAWAIAQLGWVAGPAVMLLFSFVSYYTASLLSDCYRGGDPVSGKRNYTYMDAVRSILGNTSCSQKQVSVRIPSDCS